MLRKDEITELNEEESIVRLFLLNMHLLTPEERHTMIGILEYLVIPKYVKTNKLPIEEDYLKKNIK